MRLLGPFVAMVVFGAMATTADHWFARIVTVVAAVTAALLLGMVLEHTHPSRKD